LEEVMSDGYQGPVRILGSDGVLLTTGRVSLEADEEHGNWVGVLETLNHTAVAGKALMVTLETPDGHRGNAQLVPASENGDRALSRVVGIGTERPF
jgi:hypothetical protein